METPTYLVLAPRKCGAPFFFFFFPEQGWLFFFGPRPQLSPLASSQRRPIDSREADTMVSFKQEHSAGKTLYIFPKRRVEKRPLFLWDVPRVPRSSSKHARVVIPRTRTDLSGGVRGR